LRLPAEAIEQLVTSRVRQWLLDPGSIYPVTRPSDPSAPRRLIARAAEIGKSCRSCPQPASGLVERIDIGANQIDIHVRATRLGALFDGPAAPLVDEANDETQILSVPVRLRQSGREIRMLIDRADPFSTAKPDARLIRLLIRAHRFNATLAGSGRTPFAALAKQEGVSPSYFTRLVRFSYLAPDITQAILDGRQPSHLTADKLLAHSRLPLAWQDQRTLLGFA
jgi:site-specific DNA recombinase